MLTPARRLLLVRHGLPDYSGGQPGDEWPGPPLSEVGRRQAAQAADVLRPRPPAVIYSSPLARALQTAEVISNLLGCPVRHEAALREWHRTEQLYDVTVRLTRWLVRWLSGDEAYAVVVSHASPLLAILRSALYLPQVPWHKTGHPERLEVSSGDRLEVSMASVFELVFEPQRVTARRLLHPEPRVYHCHGGRSLRCLPRPVPGAGENEVVQRPNWLHLIGHRP